MSVQSTRFAGLDFPDGTPIADLEALHGHLSDTHLGGKRPHWPGYGAGLNGWMYRLIQCSDAEARFRTSLLSDGMSPPMPQRFQQECDLFVVFVAGLSSLECLYFALAYAGAMAQPSVFAFVADERSVTPPAVAGAYAVAWPTEPLTTILSSAHTSAEWSALAATRNVLAHRAGPGRNFFEGGERHGEADWLDRPLTLDTTREPRDWVVATSAEIIRAAAPFARTHVPTPQ